MIHPKTIFFDVGNTLLFPNPQRVLAALHRRGIVPTEKLWQALERRTKKEFDDIVQRTGHADHGFWYLFYGHLFEEFGVQDELLRDALLAATRVSANWDHMRPGTREALEKIGRQYRMGVISNADGKVAEVLERCGIRQCFLSVTDSGNVGHEKPDPAIFQAALHGLKAQAEESLYVGDVYSVDYLGATAAGMRAVLFDVAGTYRDTDLPRVESLEELQHWLAD